MQASPPYPTIRDRLAAGKVIPFLGAGASSGLRKDGEKWHKGSPKLLPFAGELAEYLARASSLDKEVPRDLSAVADYYEQTVGRGPLREELRTIFRGNQPLRPIHRVLAEAEATPVIVTTNYDDLIERALAERDREFDLVVEVRSDKKELLYRPHKGVLRRIPERELEYALVRAERTLVYKIHGTIVREPTVEDDYVITDGDYLQILTRMTRKKIVPAPIGEAFANCHFLFLGYGLKDWNVRVMLNQIRPYLDAKQQLEIRSWAIDERPSVADQRFWDRRGVLVYGMKLDDFTTQLTEA